MSATVDIVVFEVGGVQYGADASQVLRISRALDEPSVGSPLGACTRGTRALIFTSPGGVEHRLDIDAVAGVRTVAIESLRRLPGPARVGPVPIGTWLDGERAVLLVDLAQMAAVQGEGENDVC